MPLFVPKLWGKYPDQIARDEQQAAAEAVRLDALRRAGMITFSFSFVLLSASYASSNLY